MKPTDYVYLDASSQFGNVVLSSALNTTILPRIFQVVFTCTDGQQSGSYQTYY